MWDEGRWKVALAAGAGDRAAGCGQGLWPPGPALVLCCLVCRVPVPLSVFLVKRQEMIILRSTRH